MKADNKKLERAKRALTASDMPGRENQEASTARVIGIVWFCKRCCCSIGDGNAEGADVRLGQVHKARGMDNWWVRDSIIRDIHFMNIE